MQSSHNSTHHIRPINRIDTSASCVIVFFLSMFAMWTLASHAATFLNIPWQSLRTWSLVGAIPATFVAAWLANSFSGEFNKESSDSFSAVAHSLPQFFAIIAITALVLAVRSYQLRFVIIAIAIAFTWRSERKNTASPVSTIIKDTWPFSPLSASWILIAITILTALVTLTAHRSDFDDSSFLQIADQTLRYPQFAPMTFDASLGSLIERFRFAPYKISSYETLAAFVADISGISLFNVYYIVLPGLSSMLTVGVAYLFSRWFLPAGLAILAVAAFILLMLSWGESHIAYGSRVFVRLFQGKSLLIALTTPVTILAGLLFLRRPSLRIWIVLALSQIAAIGTSTNGLVCTVAATALIFVLAVGKDRKKSIFLLGLIALTLIYPAALAIWLKMNSTANASLQGIGTHLPINASLGLWKREAITLAGLAIGIATFRHGAKNKEFPILVTATILFILNPWASELLAKASSRNMSWRLAWSAPVPLLLAISFIAAASPLLIKKYYANKKLLTPGLAGCALFLAFLMAGPWAISSKNNVQFSYPSAVLPPEYQQAQSISAEIKKLPSGGTVLASQEIAAWFPMIAPELPLVMAGHTYPIMFSTILPEKEFNERMALFKAIHGFKTNSKILVALLRKYNVSILVLPSNSDGEKLIGIITSHNIKIEHNAKLATHSIYSLTYY
jgi:hypothetical protein